MPQVIDALRQLVQIRSVSSDPNHQSDVHESAATVKNFFSQLGFDARISQVTLPSGEEGKPAVLAQKIVSEDAPTVLLYAHHDVQPVGELGRWDKPPFDLTIEGDRLYGRGSADDGAGIVVHYGALLTLGEDLRVNVKIFIEGEEEIGSPSFDMFLQEHRNELAADVIIVADSNNWEVEVPALTASLRGVVACDVKIAVLEHGVHSGMFGGPVLDAVTLAARLINTLHDENGAVAVEGLGGTKRADVEWEETDFRRDASVIEGYQLAGDGDLAARVWTQPALAVIGFDARSIAESSNTIAPECTFRLSLRTVPGTDPNESLQSLTGHLYGNVPFGAQVTVTPVEVGPGYLADLTTFYAKKLFCALQESWGERPVQIGVGGSIPFISQFQEAFPRAEVLVTGVEDPQSNAHSENESASLKVIRNAVLAEALFLADLL